jgi:sugar phosphate isomerase/epimerase
MNDVVEMLLGLGGRPQGDPDAAARSGAELLQLAQRLESVPVVLMSRYSSIPYFVGPQADRHAKEVDAERDATMSAAADLRRLAALAVQLGQKIEAEQNAWDRSLHERTIGVPQHLVEAARQRLGI